MKAYRLLIVLGLLTTGMIVDTPHAVEKHYPLSKKAKKGYLYSVGSEDGNIKVTYRIKGDQKDEVAFQVYEFDKDLNLLGADPKSVKVTPESRPDYTRKSLFAYVGGTNSFTVLSMAIKFSRQEKKFTWNDDKRRYDSKTLTDEDVKLKNDNGKKYQGYADYYNGETGNALALVKVEDKYSLLNVSFDMDVKETPFEFGYPVAPVYTCKLNEPGSEVEYRSSELGKNDKMLFLFSPGTKKGVDGKTYTLIICDRDGRIVSRENFTSPSMNLGIMDAAQVGNDIYMFGGSSNDLDALYYTVYGDYTKIYGAAAKVLKYEKMAKDYKFFHVVKITNGKVVFASTANVKDFKGKLRTPPGQKSRVTSYAGERLSMGDTYVSANGDIFFSGQKTDSESKGYMYEDIVCLQFDKAGNLKAQFGIDNLNDDNKSTVFPVLQTFVPSTSDKNAAYLELLEVKGNSGYAGFWDAYNHIKTYHANYYPRIMKFDVGAAAITNIDILGAGKYHLNTVATSLFKADNKTVYVGEDAESDEIWLGSYRFE